MSAVDVSGKTVVVVGSFKTVLKSNAQNQLKALGATVRGSVSGKTDLIFAGRGGDASKTKARDLNLPIYGENELKATMAQEAPAPVVEVAEPSAPEPVVEEVTASTETPTSDNLSGKVVVVAGTFNSIKKADATKRLEALGATIRTSVSKKADMLFWEEGAYSAFSKARELGVPIYGEAVLKQVITVPVDVANKTVVVVGRLKILEKDDATKRLEALGATVRGSVSKNTDILFCGVGGAGNSLKAKELKIPIYDEEDLLATIGGSTASSDDSASAESTVEATETASGEEAAYNFEGKSVVLTGKFSEFKRSEAESLLSRAGATISGSVSKKTDLLIYGERAGSKLNKAIRFKTERMTEEEFMKILPTLTLAEPEPEPEEEPVATSTDPASEFAGLTIALTGKFVTMQRSAAQELLTAAGAKCSGSVSKKTDLLIYGERAGSKLSKAQSLGTKTMTEAEFIEVLNKSAVESDLLDGASEKVAKAAAEEEKKMRKVRAAIEEVNNSQIERWGMTIGKLLLKYVHVFQQRPDVYMHGINIGAPLSNNDQLYYLKSAPRQWLALAAEMNGLTFNWVFPENKKEISNWSEGYNGGRLNLRPIPGTNYWFWHPIPDWRKEYDDYEEECTFDDFVAEGVTVFSRDAGESRLNASLVFDNANDCERHYQGSLEGYLTEGAKKCFVWYWQVDSWEGVNFRNRIRENSIPQGTSVETIISLLEAKGLTHEEAVAMTRWLGDDVVVLLHLSETPEGKKLEKLAKKFPQLTGASNRDMDHEMIGNLTNSADPLTQEEWDDTLKAHKRFLESGGTGGSWTPLSASGLPLCLYQGADASDGEQAVFRLKKIEGINAKKVELPWSDLSGARFVNINFSGADLSNCMIIDSIMDGCNFAGANLQGTDFSGTSLKGANFKKADLTGADMEATDLTGADFKGAKLADSRFPGAIVTDVKI